ncbi:MAG: Beta-galactosidase C-terminal domain, partial [Candidatus Dormibacteraeota bacterium]|nr:Beta-galactosidase C-terminal domain [Candidatus Dormibacteraeota bacterium]
DLSGQPAVTRQDFGTGRTYYVGTRLDDPSMGKLLRRAWTEAGVEPAFEAPGGVEAVRRVNAAGTSFLFLLNHGEDEVLVDCPVGAMDMLTGRPRHVSSLRLGPRQVAILREVSP